MLIACDPTTGAMRWNSGTNSGDPDSVRIPDAVGQAMAGADAVLYRIPDSDTRVPRILSGLPVTIRDGQIVVGDTVPAPPDNPPAVDVYAQIAALQAWAKDIQTQVDATTEILMGGLA